MLQRPYGKVMSQGTHGTLCLKGFMDGLWVNVMVIEVVLWFWVSFAVMSVVISINIADSGTVMVALITIAEWIIVDWVIISIMMRSIESIVPSAVVAMVDIVISVVSVTSEMAISEISVVSTVSPGLNSVSISWNISVMVILKVV